MVRPAFSVGQCCIDRNPESMHDRSSEVLRTHWIRDWVCGYRVTFAVNHSTTDSATGHQSTVAKRPMLSTRIGSGNLRLASEFADPDY